MQYFLVFCSVIVVLCLGACGASVPSTESQEGANHDDSEHGAAGTGAAREDSASDPDTTEEVIETSEPLE